MGQTKGESEPATSPAPEVPKPKRKISAEGIKRIIAATKKRWRRQRAAEKAALEQAEAMKAARRKTVPAKAVKKAMTKASAPSPIVTAEKV